MPVVSIVTCPGLSASSIAVRSGRCHQSGTFFRLACPAHGDTGLSLAIRDLPEGGIGARCFTHGCSYHEIAQTLGLPKPESESYQCPVEACRSRADSLMAIYTHAEGFVGGVHRQEIEAGKRCFRTKGDDTCPRDGEPHKEQWSCPTGAPPGGWLIPAWGPDDDENTLLICEGEKAARAALRHGLDGYTPVSYRGSGAAASADYSLVEDRRVCIWPDHDQAGLKAAETVGLRCLASGAVEIKVLDVSGLPTGADAADVDAPAAAALVAAATPFETEREPLSNFTLNQERYGISERTELRAAARLILDFADRLLVAFAPDGTSRTFVDNGFGLWRLDYKALYDLFAESVNRYKKKALEDGACRPTKDGGIGDDRAWARFLQWCADQESTARLDATLRSMGGAVEWLKRRRTPPKDLTTREDADLDAHTQHMGAPNGVVDLWTGGLMTGPEARRTLTTRQIADPYVENARHGDVDKLLAHLEQRERDWLLSALGHALYGEPDERIYYLLGEAGGEGKSTVLTAIRSALAEYGGELLDGALTKQRRDGSAGLTPELGILKTARIIVKSENMTRGLDEERIKAVSGGDPIAHRDLYQGQSSLTRVVGTLLFAVNELPRMRLGEDRALARRLKILRYPAPKTVDVGLRKRLRDGREQRQAMVGLLVRHAVENSEPPGDIPSVMDALLEAQTEARGPAGQWIEDNLVRVSGSRLFTSQVWSAAQSASGNEGDTVWGLTRRSFSRMVTSVLSLERVKVLRTGDKRKEGGRESIGPRILRSCPARTPHHLTTVAAPLSMERCGFQPPRARSRFRQFRVEWSLMTGYDNHKRAGGDGNRNSRHRGGMRNG